MKRIEAILRPEGVEPVLDALKKAGCPGVMVTEIEGHGKQKGISQNWRGQEYKVDLLPKVKVEVKGRRVFVEGPKGKLDLEMPRRANAKVEKDQVIVTREGEDAERGCRNGEDVRAETMSCRLIEDW